MEVSKKIFEKIKSLPTPSIVAVSGFGGSGKSTYSNLLGAALGAPVVSVDSFAKDRLDSGQHRWESMDFKRLESEVLVPFIEGQNPIRHGHYDWAVNGIIKAMDVSHSGQIIVEGVGLFRLGLLKYFSYKIWMGVPLEEVTTRGKKRDREIYNNPHDEKWDGIWKQNDLEYFETYQPQEQADLI